MNPIKMTLLVLGVWVIATFVWVHFIEDVSEKPFAVVMYSIYLAPFICTIAFIVSAFFYRTWINSHRRAVVNITNYLDFKHSSLFAIVVQLNLDIFNLD